jgi:hypothetical protein
MCDFICKITKVTKLQVITFEMYVVYMCVCIYIYIHTYIYTVFVLETVCCDINEQLFPWFMGGCFVIGFFFSLVYMAHFYFTYWSMDETVESTTV